MMYCKLEDSDKCFKSLKEIADWLGVSRQWVAWCSKKRTEDNKHFVCRKHKFVIISRFIVGEKQKYFREWHRNHKK